MAFTDLHCGPTAKAFAESLGWRAECPRTVRLEKGGQIQLVRAGDAVSAQNGMWLRQAAKKGVLVDPTFVERFQRDEGLVRAVAETKSAFELPLWPVLHASGKKRSRLMQAYRAFFALCLKRKARLFVTSQGETQWDVKSPREMAAFITQLAVAPDKARALLGKEVLEWKNASGW